MIHRGWKRGSLKNKMAWKEFGMAMGKQFASYYGSDVHDITAWQALCIELQVDPVPDTIVQCKRVRIHLTHYWDDNSDQDLPRS